MLSSSAVHLNCFFMEVFSTLMAHQKQFTHRQHTVAQWHLRGFTNAEGKFFRYLQGKPVKWSCPKAECHESDFYEYDFHGRKSDNKFEHLLGQIENNAASRLPDLLNKVPLSQQGCKDWALYVASLFVRSRKYRAQIGKPSQALDRADDSLWTKRRASYTSMEDAYGFDSRSISFMDAEPNRSLSRQRYSVAPQLGTTDETGPCSHVVDTSHIGTSGPICGTAP